MGYEHKLPVAHRAKYKRRKTAQKDINIQQRNGESDIEKEINGRNTWTIPHLAGNQKENKHRKDRTRLNHAHPRRKRSIKHKLKLYNDETYININKYK